MKLGLTVLAMRAIVFTQPVNWYPRGLLKPKVNGYSVSHRNHNLRTVASSLIVL